LRKKRSTQLLRECWSFLTKLITCQNLQNKLLNITVLFIWYLLASLKKMSLAKHGELYFILASTCFSPLAVLASVWKKWFPTLHVCNLRHFHWSYCLWSPGTPVCSTNKTDRHDITEILLKVALSTISSLASKNQIKLNWFLFAIVLKICFFFKFGSVTSEKLTS
jgi:hypothetical protein